jgi:O-antigen ligase
MNWLFFFIGIGVTFKSGPISIGGVLSVSDIAAVAAIFALIVKLISENRHRGVLRIASFNPAYFIISVTYILTAMGHTLIGGVNKSDFSNLITSVLILLCVFSIYQLCFVGQDRMTANKYTQSFMKGVLAGLILPFLLMNLGIVPARDVLFFPGGRYKAFLSHQNTVGIISSFTVSFFLITQIKSREKAMLVCLCLVPLLLCTSKLNLALSSLLIFTYFVIVMVPASIGVRLLVLCGAVAAMIPFLPLLATGGIKILMMVNPEGAARIALFAANPTESNTVTERLYIWQSAIVNGTDALPFGVGISGAPQFLLGLNHAHNAVLNNYLVFGLPGLAHYIGIVMLCFIGLKRYYNMTQTISAPLFAGFIGLLASNMSDSFSNTTSLVVYPLIAMGWAIIALEKRT